MNWIEIIKKLEDDIKSEISGHFLDGVLALLEPSDQYEVKCLRNAIKGLGTDEQVLIQILCSKEAHEVETQKLLIRDVLFNQRINLFI